MRATACFVLVAVLLAGCTPGGADKPPAPAPAPVTEPVTEPAPVVSVTRVDLPRGEAIDKPGLYYLDVATGKVEGWRTDAEAVNLIPVNDFGYFMVGAKEKAWLINRETGATHAWDPAQHRLVAAAHGRFLFEEHREGRSQGRFVVRDGSFAQVGSFALPDLAAKYAAAAFSPDGKTVVIGSTWEKPEPFRLVDVSTGKATMLDPLPAVTAGQLVGVLLPGQSGPDLLIEHVIAHTEKTGMAREESMIRRYSWAGKLLAEFSLEGRAGVVSPDGRYMHWTQDLDGFTRAVVLQDLASGRALFRVASADLAHWMGGSAGLMLETSQGLRLVSMQGDLRPGPQFPPEEGWVTLAGVLPSPAEGDRFLHGPVVFDTGGRVVQQVLLAPGESPYWVVNQFAWAPDGREVRFIVSPPVGKGNLGDLFAGLPPQVQKPPFADPFLLEVQDPAGECLNLREQYSTSSRVIRCLPNGTRLAAGDLWEAPVKLNAPYWQEEGRLWLWVRTDKGEQGWVAFLEGSITWVQQR
ncbi:MAG TPA: SH3 domain-containing protein [Symbiobacteriaceae bacterium]|nr:SH3 domain-containing protein [Symbiobacteriaceae bacterium]